MKKFYNIIILASVLAVASLIATGCGTEYYNPKPGTMVVVRGEDIKNTKVKQILCSDAGAVDIGWDTQARPYHAADSRRYYSITTTPGQGDKPGPDSIKVETADGVVVGVEGVFSFHTNFTCDAEGKALLKKFDEQFGTRKFPIVGSGEGTDDGPSAAVWQKGSQGWGALLDVEVRQKGIDPVVKDSVAPFTCAQVSTLCAAMKNSEKGKAVATEADGDTVAKTKDELEKEVVDALNAALKDSMGDEYLTFTSFDITAVTLPQSMRESVQAAQTAYSDVSKERAELEKEKVRAQARTFESEQYTREQRLQLEIAQAMANCKGCRIYWGVDAPNTVVE